MKYHKLNTLSKPASSTNSFVQTLTSLESITGRYGGPKVSRQFQLRSRQFQFDHGNFNFTHGNFNLTTAISIWSRQFQLHSRQFQFGHGNFNFNLTTANSITSRQFFSTFLRTGNSRSDRLEAVEGP